MSYLADLELSAQDAAADLGDALEGLLADLGKNGQIWGQPLIAGVGSRWHATVHVPHLDALDPSNDSPWVRRARESLVALLGAPLVWRVRGAATSARSSAEQWRACPAFVVATHVFQRTSPLHAGDDGEPAPLYLLPLEPLLREQLTFWMRSFATHDAVWLDSGALEEPAYDQLAQLDGELVLRARELAASVEAAVGRPTYHDLHAYYVPPRPEQCPSCDARWVVAEVAPGAGLGGFDYRCDPCRLVSRVASCVREGSDQ